MQDYRKSSQRPKVYLPEMKGVSHKNLKYMVHYAKEYPDLVIGQQVVAQFPWGHNILLLQKLETLQDRLWYVRECSLDFSRGSIHIDLLFYHYKLRCFIVVELKATDFKPEFVGKMNFYLSAVDDKMRHPDDKSTIGVLLCKGKNKVVAEYALRDVNKPIGIMKQRS